MRLAAAHRVQAYLLARAGRFWLSTRLAPARVEASGTAEFVALVCGFVPDGDAPPSRPRLGLRSLVDPDAFADDPRAPVDLRDRPGLEPALVARPHRPSRPSSAKHGQRVALLRTAAHDYTAP
jgi:hypothetical protein